MNKPDKSSIFKTSLLVALVGSAFGAHAAGLGKLTVYSAIGQPLNAEVVLTATTEELNSLSAKLASHEAFKDAGIEFMSALTGLRMNVAKSSAGKPVLRLTTDAPLNEPFLHFLVELNWTAGRMVREYTFLLDPPEMLQVAKPATLVAPVTKAAEPQTAAVKPMPAPVAVVPAARPAARSEVRVKPGDTLSRIAREHKPETVSLDQMLVALFNSNREAFDGSNMNRLRAGKILKLPDANEAAGVNPGEARQMIVAQAADFNAYRRRLAEAAGAASVAPAEPQQQATGKIKPLVEEKTPPAPVADKLEVSRTEAAKGTSSTVDKGRLEEELIARDKALREASERIAQLEKNLTNLKHLAELKSQAGAQMQQQAQSAATESKPEAAPKPAEPVAATQVEAAKPAAPAPEMAKPPVPATPKPEAKKAPPPPPPPEPSFVEENPELVLGGGGLIALLLGYFGYNAWRRKKREQEDTQFHGTSSSLAENEPSGTAEPVSVVALTASDDVSVLGDFSEGGALTTEESVDPVAEADVLMAYGRDGQAEEILLEGLKHDPERTAIHAKLLELYANRMDAGKFEFVASELHDLSNGQGPEWVRATALARDLGIAGGLFAATASGVAAVAATDLQQAAREGDAIVRPSAEESSVESPVSADVRTATPAESEPASLDFDLDLGTTSMPAVAALAESTSEKPEPEPALGMDFDFDLGTPSAPEPPPETRSAETVEPAIEAEGESVSASADSDVIDFSLDAGEAEEAPAVAAEHASAAPEVAIGADEIDFDLDLGQDATLAGPDNAAQSEPPMDAVAESPAAIESPQDIAESAGLDFDFGTEEAATEVEQLELPSAAAEEDAPVFDLGLADISLDLKVPDVEPLSSGADDAAAPSTSGLTSGAEVPAAVEADLALPEIDLAVEPGAAGETVPVAEADDPEVATKLELALAYEEMGDRDGARELLNEVLSEGSAAQQAQAQARLDQLDA